MGIRTLYLFGLGGLLITTFGAQSAPPAAHPADIDAVYTDTPQIIHTHFLDRTHHRMTRRVAAAADRIDTFFGDERHEAEVEHSRVRARTSVEVDDEGNLDLKLRFSAKLALPKLRKRLQLIVGAVSDDEQGQADPLSPETGPEEQDLLTESENYFTGLRYRLDEIYAVQLNLDGGLKFRSGPVPFTRLRARHTRDWKIYTLRFTQYLYWFNNDGFGETTRIDLERTFGSLNLGRFSSRYTWSETSEGVDWKQSLSLFHFVAPGRHKAISLDLAVSGHTEPTIDVEEYVTRITFRRRIHHDWLFLDIAPAVAFPRDNDWDATPRITITLDALFDTQDLL